MSTLFFWLFLAILEFESRASYLASQGLYHGVTPSPSCVSFIFGIHSSRVNGGVSGSPHLKHCCIQKEQGSNSIL
jgi:hypothetical protein